MQSFFTLFRPYLTLCYPLFTPLLTTWWSGTFSLHWLDPHSRCSHFTETPSIFCSYSVSKNTGNFTSILPVILPVFSIFNQVFNQERSVIWTWQRDHNRFNTRILVDCMIFNAVSRYFTITMLWFTPVNLKRCWR